MLFQLDDLNISCHGFRLVFSIIRRAYYDKVIECTVGSLMEYSKLSKYKVKEGLKELKELKLIQVIESGYNLEITLLPKLIKMIALDFKRRGGSGKAKAIGEIKKSGSSSKKATGTTTKNSSTSKTSTQKPLLSGSKNSLNDTNQNKKPKPEQKEKASGQEPKVQQEQTPKPSPKVKEKVNLKGLVKRPEYVNTRGEIYTYFKLWLTTNETISDVYSLSIDMLDKKWKDFKEYSVTWVKIQKHSSSPCTDLNRVKFMKKLAAEQLAQAA